MRKFAIKLMEDIMAGLIRKRLAIIKMIDSSCISTYSLVPKESNVTLVPHITLIRINTLTKWSPITLIRINLHFWRENR